MFFLYEIMKLCGQQQYFDGAAFDGAALDVAAFDGAAFVTFIHLCIATYVEHSS